MAWVSLGLKLLPVVTQAVIAVEAIFRGKGKQKEDAAVAAVAPLLALVEGGVQRDLLDDPTVEDAVRKVIVAVVALQNVVATRVRPT